MELKLFEHTPCSVITFSLPFVLLQTAVRSVVEIIGIHSADEYNNDTAAGDICS